MKKSIKFETVDEAFAYLRPKDIREGMFELLKEYGLYNWDMRNRVSAALVRYLKSEGLVKVVDSEMPLQVFCYKCGKKFDLSNESLLKAGYRLTKELE